MYERSAIVLERYFENLLNYRDDCNIRENFQNYCKLVEKLEKYQINYQKEVEATQEFRESVNKVKAVQAAQDKLYKKSAKLEYNRNLLFGNVEGKVEETRKCIEKIEVDVEKNNEAMKENKENLILALNEYNEKRFELSKCKRYKKMAENDYNEILEEAKSNFEGISQEAVNRVKEFAKFSDIDDIIECLDKNGKDEKIPFNEGVISDATKFGLEVAKKEAAGYLLVHDKMGKLLTDIRAGTAKITLHKKYLRNEKAKMDFLFSVKEYIVQFLDYERMTVLYGRKSHNRLMSEACENFNTDIVQINNLYELLLKEVANKATKKAYKELYNKSYLIDIQEKEEKFKKEKSRVNLNTATLINSNYWRIDGIKSIYAMFYKNVFEVFGRDVEEFDLPKEITEDSNDDSDVEVEDIQDNDVQNIVFNEPAAEIPFEINGAEELDEEDDEQSNEDLFFSSPKSNVYDDETEDDDDDEIIFNIKNKAMKEIPSEDDVEEADEDYEDEVDEVDKDDEENEDDEYSDASEEDDSDEEYMESEEYDDIIDNVVEELQEGSSDEFDIFGEKYQKYDFSESNIFEIENKKENKKSKKSKIEIEDYDIVDDGEEITIDEEENLFSDIKSIKRSKNSKADTIEDFDPVKEETNTKTLFRKIKKASTNMKKKNSEGGIW